MRKSTVPKILAFLLVPLLYSPLALAADSTQVNEDRTLSLPPEMNGRWESDNPSWGGGLYIRKQKLSGDGSSFSGEIEFDNSNSSCWGYHPFKGTVAKNGALTITSNLGGLCGVVVIKVPTPGRKWGGTYDAEFPDRGAIELSSP